MKIKISVVILSVFVLVAVSSCKQEDKKVAKKGKIKIQQHMILPVVGDRVRVKADGREGVVDQVIIPDGELPMFARYSVQIDGGELEVFDWGQIFVI